MAIYSAAAPRVMDTASLQDRIERLSVILRAELRALASVHDLKLVQLEALRYLAEANRFSDTPAAVAEGLGLTRGTVSQTLRTLQKKGLVHKTPDEHDGRVVHCHLTDAGRALVEQSWPSGLLSTAVDRWPRERLAEVYRHADALLRAVQEANGMRTFGVCHTCRHFETAGDKTFRCALFEATLTPAEMMQRCREHDPPDPG